MYTGTLKTIGDDVETLPASKVYAVVHVSKSLYVEVLVM